MICVGIDVGSRTVKVAVIEAGSREIIASGMADQGVEQEALARELFERVLAGSGADRGDISRIVATGYGRRIVGFADTTVTEITCQARGVRHVTDDARTIIDMGGQDTKVINLDRDGSVRDFSMNDRCAAGTGRFLEVVAQRLGVPLDSLGAMADNSTSAAQINSTCVVFAETEIVGLLASGAAGEDIAAGVEASLASRVGTMVGGNSEPPVVFTGGVALLGGMVEALSRALGREVRAAPRPQMTGAIGAAVLAAAM